MDPAWSADDLFRLLYPSVCHPGFPPVYQPSSHQLWQPPAIPAAVAWSEEKDPLLQGIREALRALNFWAEYAAYEQGIQPSLKQVENTTSRVSRVRSFLFHLSAGKSNLALWLFLNDMPAVCSTSVEGGQGDHNCYLRNILQFLGYLKDTPPRACRLCRAQIHMGCDEFGQAHSYTLAKLKAKKMARRCQKQARVVILELPTRMEDDGWYNLRDDFYGYFPAFDISIYGHRPGVLTNMTVSSRLTPATSSL
ncbi:hypothetical protein EYF80_058026 [Liparis tanakae]|uniref:Uncharacterized protein n=1 Tax=Liparis tanakae TaxID=230148 RepID=A0A4Z2ESC5_9TELE|nr:hypothetical protein EYF80_058026 [Liparis tanakae]